MYKKVSIKFRKFQDKEMMVYIDDLFQIFAKYYINLSYHLIYDNKFIYL